MKRLTFALGLAMLGMVSWLRAASIPLPTVNYQGQLTDLNGLPQNGTFNLTFTLFDSAVGGNQISTASVGAPGTVVTSGLFDVELNTFGVSSTAMVNSPMWLEITVGIDKMSPRRQILSSMFANNSTYVLGYQPGGAVGNLPIIQANGHLDPNILSAPFPLAVTGTGTGYAIYAQNQNVISGQSALVASGYDGVSSTAAGSNGVGVYGTAPSTGIGVKAELNSSSSVALLASNSNANGLAASIGGGGSGLGLSASNTGLTIGGGSLGGVNLSTPNTGINVNSSLSGIVINNSGSGNGLASTNSGNAASVYGLNKSASGIGVSGEHAPLAASGFGIGVQGQSNSSNGKGVQGLATNASGVNYGVYGSTVSSGGFGIYGSAPNGGVVGNSGGNSGAGVYGISSGTDGSGLFGEALGSGDTAGVYGTSSADSSAGVFGTSPGYGVSGQSTGDNGDSIGVYGLSDQFGVVGDAVLDSGVNAIGVMGRSASPDGIGVYGEITSANSGLGYGVEGVASQAGGTGVFGNGGTIGVLGIAPGTGGTERGVVGIVNGTGNDRRGVYGSIFSNNNSDNVYGVFGEVSGTTNVGTGVYGADNFPNGYGMQAYNTAATGAAGGSGAALLINGKIHIYTDNASHFPPSATAPGPFTNWFVQVSYCDPQDVVLIFPTCDISAGGTLANALWVSNVASNGFTVRSSLPVTNLTFNYLVIAK